MKNESSFKNNSIKVISDLKNSGFGHVRFYSPSDDGVYITPVTVDKNNEDFIETLAKWRSENQNGFTKVFKVTVPGTHSWLKNAVQNRKDRILFVVYDRYDIEIGHLGVSSFNFKRESCEIDNVIRGEVSRQEGVMYSASQALLNWIKEFINPEYIHLRVLNDNSSALSLYHRLGFKPYRLIPLEKEDVAGYVEWVPLNKGNIDRFFIEMRL